ncbi:MAG TPA: glycogen/starch/alpha-glucan phosphorylase [Clostridia bacterium]|jgi:starch phosphorylase|nr:glycogen/starch/alpha-glucan phosphorylase [Clostridia bacterium]
MAKITKIELKERLEKKLAVNFGIKYKDATEELMYRALCLAIKDILTEKRVDYKAKSRKQGNKHVCYMSMEFLLGRSLKNHLFNLGIFDLAKETITELGFDIDRLIEIEPDAGLGNGGLGRLAAAYLDSLTARDYVATGYCLRYDYGIFKQKIVDGWQMEMPDEWLKQGDVWLNQRSETWTIKFNGYVEEHWDENGKLVVEHKGATEVIAVPYDVNISGYKSKAVNVLRLWSATAPVQIDMSLFSRGEYLKAIESRAIAESISKVLYPADNHPEGKSLRLKQQYFFVSASIQSIIHKHLKHYGTLSNLGDKLAIHINDTHPTLCIPEMMRVLLDNYGYSWDDAWEVVTEVMSYTNHTVMQEALETWPEALFASLLPRIYQIVKEINQRFCNILWDAFPGDWQRISDNAIISDGEIRMANLCLASSHTINGVSALHSEILKQTIFSDYYKIAPEKFTNVTNGITHRRWLAQANPLLTDLLRELLGSDKFLTDPVALEKLVKFQGDHDVLDRWHEIKVKNKERLAEYISKTNCVTLNPDSIFDVQVKRLHEYKRQLLNAFNILDLYLRLKENPNLDITPRTFIFGAEAASSYYMAKLIIRLIYMMSEVINNDPDIKGKIKIVFLENYRVSLAEIIMPAAEISEQISTAGKEASGTGNMKFMINGAVTIGTMDGANVEIHERVGDENIFIFGLRDDEVEKLRPNYNPTEYYSQDERIRNIIDLLRKGINGVKFSEIADSLTVGRNGTADPYFVLADFASYVDTQNAVDEAYKDKYRFQRMSLKNTAYAGFFAADRSVEEYATRIWRLDKFK